MGLPIRSRKNIKASRASMNGDAGKLAATKLIVNSPSRYSSRVAKSNQRLDSLLKQVPSDIGPESTTMRMGSDGQAYDSEEK